MLAHQLMPTMGLPVRPCLQACALHRVGPIVPLHDSDVITLRLEQARRHTLDHQTLPHARVRHGVPCSALPAGLPTALCQLPCARPSDAQLQCQNATKNAGKKLPHAYIDHRVLPHAAGRQSIRL